jgi:hypothetical protein
MVRLWFGIGLVMVRLWLGYGKVVRKEEIEEELLGSVTHSPCTLLRILTTSKRQNKVL